MKKAFFVALLVLIANVGFGQKIDIIDLWNLRNKNYNQTKSLLKMKEFNIVEVKNLCQKLI